MNHMAVVLEKVYHGHLELLTKDRAAVGSGEVGS